MIYKIKALTIVLMMFSFVTLNATGELPPRPSPTPDPDPIIVVPHPIADDKNNPKMLNSLGAVNILDLSGKDHEGNALHQFIITSLPREREGILLMADGKNLVTVDQELTQEEADGLLFDPNGEFEGEVSFTYVVIDSNDARSDPATVTIPLIAPTITVEFRVDDKKNPEMVNTLGPVNILDLSGQDSEGDALDRFRIVSLPDPEQGVLYMADGTTAVELNQILTREEADGIKFDPDADFVGTVHFDYVGLDDDDNESSAGTVTIPVVGPVVGAVDDTDCCPDYTDGIPSLNYFALLFLFILSSMLGGVFLYEEEEILF